MEKNSWKNIATRISIADGNQVSAERCRQIANLACEKLARSFAQDPYISEYFRDQGVELLYPDNKDLQ